MRLVKDDRDFNGAEPSPSQLHLRMRRTYKMAATPANMDARKYSGHPTALSDSQKIGITANGMRTHTNAFPGTIAMADAFDVDMPEMGVVSRNSLGRSLLMKGL